MRSVGAAQPKRVHAPKGSKSATGPSHRTRSLGRHDEAIDDEPPWALIQQQVGNRALARLAGENGSARGAVRREPDKLQNARSGGPGGTGGTKPKAKWQTGGAGWRRISEWEYRVDNYVSAARAASPRLDPAPDVRAAMNVRMPQLVAALTSAELTQWGRVVAHRDAAEQVVRWERRMDAARVAEGFIQHVDGYDHWLRGLQAQIPKLPAGTETLELDPMRLVDPAIYEVPLDKTANIRFRTWALERIAAKKIRINLWDAYFRSDAPSAATMVTGRFTSGGRITASDLEREFAAEYRTMVSERPEVVQLRKLRNELEEMYDQLHPLHVERSDLNKKYSGWKRGVRIYSEALGEGDQDYPTLKLWEKPKLRLDQGSALLRGGDIEGAVRVLMTAVGPMQSIAEKFAAYETRVTTGASIAVGWLGRLKFAGTLAAGVASGPLGLVRASLVAGGYTAAQEGAQQISAVAVGQQDQVHWGEIATNAGIATVMSLFGGAITEKFKVAILARIGTAEAGTVNVVEEWLAGVLASSTSTVYQVPVQMVLDRVANGKAFPNSPDEFADLIVEEAIKNGTISAATDAISMRAGHGKGGADAAESIGADLLALAKPNEPMVPTGSDSSKAVGEAGGGGRVGDATVGAHEAKAGTSPSAPDHSVADGSNTGGSRPDKSQSPDNTYETGLMSEDSKKRLADGAIAASEAQFSAKKRGKNDPLTAKLNEAEIRQSVNRLEKVIAAELKSSGMPMPKVRVEAMNNPLSSGYYDRGLHMLVINSNATKFTGPGGFAKLLGTMVHEVRHAEQAFDALRVRAGEAPEGLDPRLVGTAIAGETNVAKELAIAAAEHPIEKGDNSAEAKLGREIWSESFQAGPRRDLRNWAQGANSRRAGVEAKLKAMHDAADASRPKSGETKYQAVTDGIQRVSEALDKAYDHYYNLAGEIDARRVQSHVEGLFQAKLRLQRDVSTLTDHLRAAEDAMHRLQPYEGASLDSLVNVLRYQNELRDSLQNQVALMPATLDAPATTAAAVAATK